MGSLQRQEYYSLPPSNQVLWRFMDFPRFYYLIRKRALYFSSLSSLTNDPWDGIIPPNALDPDTKFRTVREENGEPYETCLREMFPDPEKLDSLIEALSDAAHHRERTFVNCWHASPIESEALWRIYGGNGFGIALKTTFQKLEESLRTDYPVSASKVFYHNELTATVATVLARTAVWKRKSFEHEREFRLVIDERHPNVLGLDVSVELQSLMEEIVVHPEAKPYFVDLVKDLAETCDCGVKVRKSTLLDIPDYSKVRAKKLDFGLFLAALDERKQLENASKQAGKDPAEKDE